LFATLVDATLAYVVSEWRGELSLARAKRKAHGIHVPIRYAITHEKKFIIFYDFPPLHAKARLYTVCTMTLSEFVKVRRKHLGLTQIELANLAGLKSLTIWRIEAGYKFKGGPRITTLLGLAKALGENVEKLAKIEIEDLDTGAVTEWRKSESKSKKAAN
jgi:DNA-binding XRE family transcriptional regulator